MLAAMPDAGVASAPAKGICVTISKLPGTRLKSTSSIEFDFSSLVENALKIVNELEKFQEKYSGLFVTRSTFLRKHV